MQMLTTVLLPLADAITLYQWLELEKKENLSTSFFTTFSYCESQKHIFQTGVASQIAQLLLP